MSLLSILLFCLTQLIWAKHLENRNINKHFNEMKKNVVKDYSKI